MPKIKRNNSLLDNWSLLHLGIGILLGWTMSPYIALLLLVLWEPLEILVLSPILDRFGIVFGYETLKNSISDIIVDAIGVLIGACILGALVDPPLHLFS